MLNAHYEKGYTPEDFKTDVFKIEFFNHSFCLWLYHDTSFDMVIKVDLTIFVNSELAAF